MNTHVMDCVKQNKDGYYEFVCPTCDRSVLICFNPYDKIVLSVGDESSPHSGGIGGLSISSSFVSEHDPYLDVFNDWINKND